MWVTSFRLDHNDMVLLETNVTFVGVSRSSTCSESLRCRPVELHATRRRPHFLHWRQKQRHEAQIRSETKFALSWLFKAPLSNLLNFLHFLSQQRRQSCVHHFGAVPEATFAKTINQFSFCSILRKIASCVNTLQTKTSVQSAQLFLAFMDINLWTTDPEGIRSGNTKPFHTWSFDRQALSPPPGLNPGSIRNRCAFKSICIHTDPGSLNASPCAQTCIATKETGKFNFCYSLSFVHPAPPVDD